MGYLATSRQYGNALLAVRHQEEEAHLSPRICLRVLSARFCLRVIVCALLSARNYPARFCLRTNTTEAWRIAVLP